MNNSQQFDNYIKEQFSSYAPDVHPRIWENIAARNERRKPVGFWNSNKTRLLLAGLFLAISTGTAWWYFNKTAAPVNTETASGKNSVPGNQQITTGKDQIPCNPSISKTSSFTLYMDLPDRIELISTCSLSPSREAIPETNIWE